MEQVVKINLDNEMDLILVHKRTMKLAELCGLSAPSQTTFATAVSEIARCAISHGEKSFMTLGIDTSEKNKKNITASLFDLKDLSCENHEAFSYAKRLMGEMTVMASENGLFEIRLVQRISFGGLITASKIKSIKEYFKNEPPISPYDEIRKKNILLIDLAARLQESESQYRLLTDTLPLMMFSIENNGEVSYSNQWLKDFFGEGNKMITGLSWQSMIHPEDIKNIWKAWDESQLNKVLFRAEGRLKDKEGQYLWHLISIVPVKDDNGEILNWIGFFVDIHSQKLVEETLKDNKELKEARSTLESYQIQLEQKISELNISNQNLEQFAFIASHDLQEPLRKITTYSNILEDSLALSKTQKLHFDKIKSATKRMSTLIKDVLEYSTLSRPAEKLIDTDLAEVLENVINDLETSIAIKQASVKYTNLPVARVIPAQFSQIFSNLISNSLKFSREKPEITITSSEISGKGIPHLESGKNYFHIVYKDNGIGFGSEYADKIFTIFQRLRDTDAPGTGIGLSICRKIMTNHKGLITASGVVNVGATFNIYLPV